MNEKRKVEVFSAGCPICEETVEQVKELACPNCEVIIYDLNKGCDINHCRDKVKEYAVNTVPAVAIDGNLVSCCANNGVEIEALKATLRPPI